MTDVEASTQPNPVQTVTSEITFANRRDHFLARWGVNRMGHRVEPGLYALGSPTPESPVFVTANYTLSFDALRSALAGSGTAASGAGSGAYILVLDTKGVNVWCAAGEGTFGTEELVQRIESVHLSEVVSHRVLILPQLGAPGVAAHEVKQRSGFKVEYGPVRAEDLPEYLKTHRATAQMRLVRFNLVDRLVLIPVELVYVLLPMLITAVVLYFWSSLLMALGTAAAFLAGAVLFPILLPWIPTREFSSKGLILGAVVALPFALVMLIGTGGITWLRVLRALSFELAMTAVTAYLALNFTGSTPYTSRSGVRHEIFTYIPIMAGLLGTGVLLGIVTSVLRAFGVI